MPGKTKVVARVQTNNRISRFFCLIGFDATRPYRAMSITVAKADPSTPFGVYHCRNAQTSV
jgi:hypothetical protein